MYFLFFILQIFPFINVKASSGYFPVPFNPFSFNNHYFSAAQQSQHWSYFPQFPYQQPQQPLPVPQPQPPPSSTTSVSTSTAGNLGIKPPFPYPGKPIFDINQYLIPYGRPPYITVPKDLTASVTGWETTYNVPCGEYTIHPFVNAIVRYTSITNYPIRYPSLGRSINSPYQQQQQQQQNPTVCSWNFHASVPCKLRFNCSIFQLPALFRCTENYLMVETDQKDFNYKFCGNRRPKALVSSAENLKLTFVSQASFVYPSVFNCSVQCTLDPTTKGPVSIPPASVLIPSSPAVAPLLPPQQQQAVAVPIQGQGLNILPNIQTIQIQTPKIANCVCGVSKRDDRALSVSRVIGGKEATPGSWPWNVALVLKNGSQPFCSGSVLNSEYIITTAHCIKKMDAKSEPFFEVVLNEHDISKTNEINNEKGGNNAEMRSKIDKIIIHENYNSTTFDFDIAILHLSSPILFGNMSPIAGKNYLKGEQIVPICLPKLNERSLFEGNSATIVGWGLTKEGGSPSDKLLEANVTIFNSSLCQNLYKDQDTITERQLCAGDLIEKIDSCLGDSGGGLVVQDQTNKYTLAGLVSFGRGCGRPNLPGIYTKISVLKDWIQAKSNDGTWCFD